MNRATTPEQEYRQLQIIHLFLTGMAAVELLFAASLRLTGVLPAQGFAGFDSSTFNILLIFFTLLAVTQAVLVYTIFKPALERVPEAVRTSQNDGAIFAWLRTWSIMRWALADAIVIYGFVIFLLNGSWTYFLAFGGFGLLLLLLNAPDLETIRTFYINSPRRQP